MPVVSAAEAAQIIRNEQRSMNAAILPPTLARIQRLMQEETFPICNVGPWEYRQERGCIQVYIPKYDPKHDPHKKGYAESAPFPVIRREAVNKSMEPNDYTYIEDDGRAVANDLIGVGFGMHPANSLLPYGVFVPQGPEPTGEELHAARKRLSEYADRLVQEARDAWDKGREEWGKTRSDRHLWAGRVKGIQEKWVTDDHVEESARCSFCGKFNPPDIAACSCGNPINEEAYKRGMQRRRELEEEVALEAATKPGKK